MASQNISKRRKFIADGVFYAEISEFFERELALEGYSGCVVRMQTNSTQIIIHATHTQDVLGEKARRINELTAFIKKRFGLENISLFAAKVQNRGLCAVAQCESLKYKMQNNVMPRRAAYGVLRFVMDSGAKGCEVVISGKLRGARAKSQKFTDGFMIHSGQPAHDFVDMATRCMSTDQGVLGFKVKIMLPVPKSVLAGNERADKLEGRPLPDMVTVREPKEENQFTEPISIRRDVADISLPQQQQQQSAQQQPPAEEQQQPAAGVTAEVPEAQDW